MTKIERGTVTRVANAFDLMVVDEQAVNNVGAALNGGAQLGCLEVLVQNTGAEPVFVGNQFNQYFRLAQYDSITIPINNVASVYARTGGVASTVNWIAMT